jgi:hypothetical protein
MSNPIPALKPGTIPDPADLPGCSTCGTVAPQKWGDKPPGTDWTGNADPKKAALGFQPTLPHPLEGWAFDHRTGGYYCPLHPAPKFTPDLEARTPDALRKVRWWPMTDAEILANKIAADAAAAAAGK